MGSPLRVRVRGPLQPFAAGFAAELESLGYRPNAAANLLQLMAHLSRWLDAQGLGVAALSPALTDRFLADRRAAGYRLWLSQRALRPMLSFLRRVEALAAEAPLPATPAETLVAAFERYLTAERGLAGSTIAAYTYVARLFLASDAVGGDAVLDGLTAGVVTEFVLAETAGRKVGSAKFVACGLRAFLRFAFVTGRTAIELDAAVPKIASWRLSGVPRALTQAEVARLVGCCDRRSRTGRRDHAVLLLMARLGLRAGEVARLGLVDIDWRAGEITVRGKANRVERLPLPAEVGESIAGWLQRGRPSCTDRTVFSTVRAPHRPLSSGAVSGIVTTAGARAGLGHVNAHRLRHSAATAMLQAGANLAEIGQVLRHASVATTAIYAKVDDRSLRPLALPWPSGAHS